MVDKRNNRIVKRDPTTGRIVANEEFQLESEAYQYLLEKTDSGKELVDVALRWIRSYKNTNIPWTVKEKLLQTLLKLVSTQNNGEAKINITNNIILLEEKIQKRLGEEVIDYQPPELLTDGTDDRGQIH